MVFHDVLEVARQHAGDFDAGRAGADDHVVRVGVAVLDYLPVQVLLKRRASACNFMPYEYSFMPSMPK